MVPVEQGEGRMTLGYDEADLRTFEPGRRCPKCGYDAITTVYRPGSHKDCPTFAVGDSLAGMGNLFWIGMSDENEKRLMDHYRKIAEAAARVPEHHDRTCVRCNHRWSEAVIASEPAA